MDKQKQTKILELIPAGKDEMDLAELPFALLSDKGGGIKKEQKDKIRNFLNSSARRCS